MLRGYSVGAVDYLHKPFDPTILRFKVEVLIEFFDGDMRRALQRSEAEIALRRAVERRELCLHYQPQFDLGARRMVGLEALVRWNDPERGLVSPGGLHPASIVAAVITLAQRSG